MGFILDYEIGNAASSVEKEIDSPQGSFSRRRLRIAAALVTPREFARRITDEIIYLRYDVNPMKKFGLLLILLIIAGVWYVHSRSKRRPDVTRSTTTTIADAYYVRAFKHGAYIIDHKGHRLSAKCRETRSWVDGDDKPYKLMDSNECTYMPEQVGKYIGDDLMLRFGNELHLCPWLGVKTTQTADILDITDDELE